MPINSTDVVHEGVQGDSKYAIVDFFLGDLTFAGNEAYDAEANLNINPVWGASVLDQDDPGYKVGYDTSVGNITAQRANATAVDGKLEDVPAGTDIGNVTLRFEGNPSA